MATRWTLNRAGIINVYQADDTGTSLPIDPSTAGPTPWDSGLALAFNDDRRIVHEERLLPHLLDRWEDEESDRGRR